jgi:hypothetical protein
MKVRVGVSKKVRNMFIILAVDDGGGLSATKFQKCTFYMLFLNGTLVGAHAVYEK